MGKVPQKYFIIGSVIIFIGISALFMFDYSRKNSHSYSNLNTHVSTSGEIEYQGTVTDITYECHMDGICRVKVGPYWVTILKGETLTPEPHGTFTNSLLDEGKKTEFIGKSAKIKGRLNGSNSITIYGNQNYSIEIETNTTQDQAATACNSDNDCSLFICSGACMNKEAAKKSPPDLPCISYKDYLCTCENHSCTRHK